MKLIVTLSVLALVAMASAQDMGNNWSKDIYDTGTKNYADGERCHDWTFNFKNKGLWLGRGLACVAEVKGTTPTKTRQNYSERSWAGLLDRSIDMRHDAGVSMFRRSFNWRNFMNLTIDCNWPDKKEAKCDISANMFGLIDFKGNCTEKDACAFSGELFPLGMFKLKFYLDPHNPIILNTNQIGNDTDTINKLRDFWVEPEENPKDNSSSQSFASAILRMAFRIYTKATNFYFGMMYKDLKRMLRLPNVAPPLKPTGPPGLYGKD